MKYLVTIKTATGEEAVWWCEDFDTLEGFLLLKKPRCGDRTYATASFSLSHITFWAVNEVSE